MFLYIASFIQQTEIYPEKKKKNPIPWIQAWHLESELFGLCEIRWKSEFSWKHSTPVLDRGRVGGGSPSTLFFHSCFSRLVWTLSSVPPFPIKISWEGLNASNLKLEFLGLRDLPKALYFHLSTYTHTHTHPELDFILILQQILRVGLKHPLRKKGVGRLYWKKKMIWHLRWWCHYQPWLWTVSGMQLWLESLRPPNAI